MARRRRNPASVRHTFPVRDKDKVKKGWYRRTGGRALLEDAPDRLKYVGMVVNPKTMRPYMIFNTTYEGYKIVVPTTDPGDVEALGAGYLENDESSTYALPYHVTGLPRIHTPDGVPADERGMGLGTVLYTAGSLFAAYASLHIRMDMVDNDPEDMGVSSGPGASYSAQRWWAKAASVGLAYEHDSSEYLSEHQTDVEDQVSISWSVSIDPGLVVENRDIMQQVYDEPYESDSFGMEVFDAARRDTEISELEDWSVDSASVEEDPEIEVEYQATLEVHYTDSDDEDQVAEEEIEGSLTVLLSDLEGGQAHLDRHVSDLLEEQDLEEHVGEYEGLDYISVASINVDVSRNYVEVNVSYDVDVTGTTTSIDEEDGEVYSYPVVNAFKKGLILDVTDSLYAEGHPFDSAAGAAADDLEDVHMAPAEEARALDIVLGLDLVEIEDPAMFDYFFKLANDLGASYSQLKRFQNSVLAFRGDVDYPVDFGAEDARLHAPLKSAGFRVNPDGETYEEVGHRLFGDVADLD
jgi:hypothetical protein